MGGEGERLSDEQFVGGSDETAQLGTVFEVGLALRRRAGVRQQPGLSQPARRIGGGDQRRPLSKEGSSGERRTRDADERRTHLPGVEHDERHGSRGARERSDARGSFGWDSKHRGYFLRPARMWGVTSEVK